MSLLSYGEVLYFFFTLRPNYNLDLVFMDKSYPCLNYIPQRFRDI